MTKSAAHIRAFERNRCRASPRGLPLGFHTPIFEGFRHSVGAELFDRFYSDSADRQIDDLRSTCETSGDEAVFRRRMGSRGGRLRHLVDQRGRERRRNRLERGSSRLWMPRDRPRHDRLRARPDEGARSGGRKGRDGRGPKPCAGAKDLRKGRVHECRPVGDDVQAPVIPSAGICGQARRRCRRRPAFEADSPPTSRALHLVCAHDDWVAVKLLRRCDRLWMTSDPLLKLEVYLSSLRGAKQRSELACDAGGSWVASLAMTVDDPLLPQLVDTRYSSPSRLSVKRRSRL